MHILSGLNVLINSLGCKETGAGYQSPNCNQLTARVDMKPIE